MTDAESIMWAVERDPALRSDFCNLTILDHRPDDERMRITLARALDAIPRLRQRVVPVPLRVLPPELVVVSDLDVDAHVSYVKLPRGDMESLLEACASVAQEPLDRTRPPWHFTVFEGLDDGRAAILQKIHHTITDGVGGLRLSLAFVDLEPDAPDSMTPRDTRDGDDDASPHHANAFDVARSALVDITARTVKVMWKAMGGVSRLLTHPSELPQVAGGAGRLVTSLQRQALVTDSARSDVMDARSVDRYFAVHDVSLDGLRTAAKALGGSVNDVYVTAIAAALGRYHTRFGSDVTELRMAMPVSTRGGRGDAAANRFVPSRVLIPIQPAGDVRTLFETIKERLDTIKHEAALGAAENVAAFVAPLPVAALVTLTRTQTRTIDFATTNLRGSPVPLYLAGARIMANYPFGPRTGTAVNLSVLGYEDELHVGCNIDPAAITDISAFMEDLDAAFADVVAQG